MFQTVPLSIIRSFSLYTQQWYMSCSFADGLRAGSSWNCSSILILLCVQWKTPDDGQRNCLKHVEFHSNNKFKKLMHPVGFIIQIYHEARSHERQKLITECLVAVINANKVRCHWISRRFKDAQSSYQLTMSPGNYYTKPRVSGRQINNLSKNFLQ
jgi:hypothetical protein